MSDGAGGLLDTTRFYRVFTADEDEDAAAARFVELYGLPPEQIIEDGGLLWVGPVPESQVHDGRTMG